MIAFDISEITEFHFNCCLFGSCLVKSSNIRNLNKLRENQANSSREPDQEPKILEEFIKIENISFCFTNHNDFTMMNDSGS